MTNSPLVSIVIPFFNRADLVAETLQSIFKQTYPTFEVIIVDDGSDAVNVAKLLSTIKALEDERFKYYERPVNHPKGANACRVFGQSLSKGEFVKWFDSDDLMKETLLETQVKSFRHDLDGVLCNCEVWNADFTSHLKDGWRKLNFSTSALKDYLKTQLAWQTGCGLWRREAIIPIQPFTEQITNAQEWIFHLKAMVYGLRIGVSDEKLVLIRSHSRSISSHRKTAYFINRLKARSFGLLHLFKTGNSGKRFLVKSMVHMIISQKLYYYGKVYSTLLELLLKLPAAWIFGKKRSVNLIRLHD